MRLMILFIITFGFISCGHETKSNNQTDQKSGITHDTTIVKHKNDLNKSYEVGFYSKSYTYYWITGTDTLDFTINATEHEKDSTLHLNVYHKDPVLFRIALTKINECFSLIKKDFNTTKLSSFYFKDPIFYFDLTKELSTEYEQEFGQKTISYKKLNQFLLNSNLNTKLDNFVRPFEKKVERYGIEKFQLMSKQNYRNFLPNIDIAKYPEFAIEGMGLYVRLKDK